MFDVNVNVYIAQIEMRGWCWHIANVVALPTDSRKRPKSSVPVFQYENTPTSLLSGSYAVCTVMTLTLYPGAV